MDRSLTRAERLKSLEALLYRTPGGVTASQVADRLKVHRSTAYRDLSSLAQMGSPVWQDGSRFGLLKDGYLATVRLDLHEALALYLAGRLLSAQSDEHNPHVISGLQKLAGAVPEPMADHMERTASVAGQRPTDRGYVRVLEHLARAWAESRQVKLSYRGPRDAQARTRVFDTWFIEPSATGYACYAIGLDHLRGALRTFKVERIEAVELLDTTYEVDPAFDPHEYLSSAWGVMGGEEGTTVRLWFSAGVAYRVRESRWPGMVSVVDAEDGGCELQLNVAHTLELKPWIRSWGWDCEVLEPEALRAEVAEEMRGAAGRYG